MKIRPLSVEERAQLEALVAMGDDDIDTVDIPELSEEKWANARRGALQRPAESLNAVLLENDLVSWFKSHSEEGGYQVEISRVLRRHVMDAESKRA